MAIQKIMKNKGFTLIELLVVISIIGLLSSIILVSLQSAKQKGADSANTQALVQVRNALALYAADNNNKYPIHPTPGVSIESLINTTHELLPYLKSVPFVVGNYSTDSYSSDVTGSTYSMNIGAKDGSTASVTNNGGIVTTNGGSGGGTTYNIILTSRPYNNGSQGAGTCLASIDGGTSVSCGSRTSGFSNRTTHTVSYVSGAPLENGSPVSNVTVDVSTTGGCCSNVRSTTFTINSADENVSLIFGPP